MERIAEELGMKPLYLRQRASVIYRKLGVGSRWELLAKERESEHA